MIFELRTKSEYKIKDMVLIVQSYDHVKYHKSALRALSLVLINKYF
jgi:hypothetical protein